MVNSRPDLLIKMIKIVKSKPQNSSQKFGIFGPRNLIISRRSQEEMIGFVLIIILVAVIALIFLAISIRPAKTQENKEIENFLHSSLLYTTDCKSSPEIVYDFRDLIKACLENKQCLSGEKACDILDKTASELIEKSFKVGENEKYKGYMFKIYEENNVLFEISKGEMDVKKIGSEVLVSDIYVMLELFY